MKNLNSLAASHLTEDELDEVLMGVGSTAASAHLAYCDPCGERLAAFETQMASFNQATMAWSEQRSNSMSRDLTAHKPTWRLTLNAIRVTTAALAVALAFGINTGIQHSGATLEAATPSTSATATQPAEPDQQHDIASDNEMLEAIDSEIAPPQAAQFGLYENAKTSSATASPERQVRD